MCSVPHLPDKVYPLFKLTGKQGLFLFDPTIYENLKIVLEGAVYDLDLSGTLFVTQRTDRVELSSMSRYYAIEFMQTGHAANKAELILQAHLRDLAAEILENVIEAPGCTLEIVLRTWVKDPNQECPVIEAKLKEIWEERPTITQSLSFHYKDQLPEVYLNQIKLQFGRKVDEGQIDDFPHLIRYALESLKWLNERA
jgi:hypothetical protein